MGEISYIYEVEYYLHRPNALSVPVPSQIEEKVMSPFTL